MKTYPETKVSSNQIYDGKVVKLFVDEVKCYNGNISKREYIKHPGGVCVLLEVDGKLVFERQYRYAYDKILYELPAGKLEENEDSYLAGIRELEEETGYKASSLISLGCMYPTCGYSNEIIYLYLAKDAIKTKTNLDDDESIEVVYLDLDTVNKMISENKIVDAKTLCLLYKYQLYKKENDRN